MRNQRRPRPLCSASRGSFASSLVSGIVSCSVILLAVTVGCKDRKKDSASESSETSAERVPQPTIANEAPPATSSSADSLGMMGALMAAQSGQRGPYDELRAAPGFDDNTSHLAVVEISGPITELRSFSWTGGAQGTELRRLVDHLHAVAADDDVHALLLRFDDLSIGPAAAEELSNELLGVRRAFPDKRIECHAEAISTFTYWVASACDAISLTPGGEVSIPGIAAVPMHLKGLLDKLGIRADFLHIGDYKGAAEPLTRDAPSAQANETTAMILDAAYKGLVDAIASGRGLATDEVRALIDRAMFRAEDALSSKLVNEVATFAEVRDSLSRNWRLAPLDKEGNPMTELFELIGLRPVERPRGERVALVYAVGNVVDGHGAAGGAQTEIASRTLVAALETLSRDEQVKAVVVRIASPGGSALASEVIWSAMKDLVAKKPVVVSMGAVAASGGYYIAAPATRIFALNNTLTGSIGVVGGKLATAGGLAKLGIKAYPTGRGKHALLFAKPGVWTAAERSVVRASMRAVYDQFASRVRDGRGTIDDKLMQGRVWTGAKALEHKLIDQVGGLREAIAFARNAAGLTANSPLEVYPPKATLKDMLGSFGVSSGQAMASALLASLKLDPRLSAALSPVIDLTLRFDSGAIQTALLLPLLVR